MRRVLLLFGLIYIFSASMVSAGEVKPSLQSAKIDIKVGDNHTYQVIEKLKIVNPSGAEGRTITHTLSKIKNLKAEKLIFEVDGQEVEATVNEGKTLNKVSFSLPESVGDVLEYTISYSVQLPEEEFIVPLVVPMYASAGNKNIVQISFEAPNGQIIQKNSFPVVIKAESSEVVSNMMNIPTHVKYIYSSSPSSVNSHTIISGLSLLILLLVIGTWVKVERKNIQGVA
jgi:hypothetical protein